MCLLNVTVDVVKHSLVVLFFAEKAYCICGPPRRGVVVRTAVSRFLMCSVVLDLDDIFVFIFTVAIHHNTIPQHEPSHVPRVPRLRLVCGVVRLVPCYWLLFLPQRVVKPLHRLPHDPVLRESRWIEFYNFLVVVDIFSVIRHLRLVDYGLRRDRIEVENLRSGLGSWS